MKIRFIGTSHGVPEQDRMWTSVMFTSGDNTYVIDAGASVADGVIRSGRTLDSLKALFITHQHGDHMNGLPALVDIISWYFKNSDPAIYLPDEGIDAPLTALIDATFGGSHLKDIDYRVTKPGVIYDDGTAKVTAIPTRHIANGAHPSFAFYVECEGKKVLFTGDLNASCEDHPEIAFAEELDLIVIEAAHFRLTQREQIFGRSKTKKMIVSHYAPINHDQIEQFIADMPFEVILAEDSMEFEV